MLKLVEVILTIMAIAGFGVVLLAIGGLIYFLIWVTKELFSEGSILTGIFSALGSIFIVGFIALVVILNIVKVWGY